MSNEQKETAEQQQSATYTESEIETQSEELSTEKESRVEETDSPSSGAKDSQETVEFAEAEQVSADEVSALHSQIEELQSRLLRSQADFDNFRRRTRQEKEDFAKYASSKLIEQLLPVVDNFERALAVSKESNDFEAFAKGVDMIFRQLQQVLEQEGLQPITAVGEAFDPELHQAVARVDSDEHEEGIIVEELQKGYKLKDRVIRPSMVKVSS